MIITTNKELPATGWGKFFHDGNMAVPIVIVDKRLILITHTSSCQEVKGRTLGKIGETWMGSGRSILLSKSGSNFLAIDIIISPIQALL
jgi:hypothetical protein